MPELPEIETLKNEIISYGLIGKRIVGINVSDSRAINMPVDKFRKSIIGKSIVSVDRKGKNLIFILSEGGFIVIHLKLFGQMRVSEEEIPSQLGFLFENGLWLSLFKLAFKAGAKLLFELDLNLGKDALGISLNDFKEILKKGKIKTLLMDQKIIAGIGNTYADEILFKAKIHPERNGKSLKENEILAIYNAMHEILDEAIKKGGVTLDDFIHLNGSPGRFVCRVHNCEGKPCSLCGSIIEKIKIGGRGTFFCPNCQV